MTFLSLEDTPECLEAARNYARTHSWKTARPFAIYRGTNGAGNPRLFVAASHLPFLDSRGLPMARIEEVLP